MADLNAAQAADLIYQSMLSGVPTSTFDAAGGYDKVYAAAKAGGFDLGAPPASAIKKYGPTIASQGYGNSSYAPGSTVNDPALAAAGYDNYYDQATNRKSSTYYDKQIGLLNTQYGTLNTSYLDLQKQFAALKAKGTSAPSMTTSNGVVNSGASNTSGLGVASSTGAVYGPDGTAYPGPAAAIAAGVYNYTMFPPTGTGQPLGVVNNTLSTAAAEKLSGVTDNYYGGINQNPDNPWVNLYPPK